MKNRIRIPGNANGMRDFLAAVCNRCEDKQNDPGPHIKLIVAEVQKFRPQFEAVLADYMKRHEDHARYLRDQSMVFKELRECINDFWYVLKRRNRRENYPEDLLKNYSHPLDQGAPINPASPEEAKRLALHLIKGDAQSVAQGFPAMINPSVAQLQELNDQLDIAQSDSEASISFKVVQIAYQEAFQKALYLARLLNFNLRLHYADLPASKVRDLMRKYGFKFRSDRGADEVQEPGSEDPVLNPDSADDISGDIGNGDDFFDSAEAADA